MNTNFNHKHFAIETFRVKKPALSQLLAKKTQQSQSREQQSGMKQSQFYKSISGQWFSQTFLQTGVAGDSNFNQMYALALMEKLEPRDQKIIVPYMHSEGGFQLSKSKKQVDQWLGEMTFAVSSASFNMLLTKRLSYEETKIYYCENLLLNLLLFMESVQPDRTYQTMEYFNTRLVSSLEYLKKKYPQTKETKPNKKLRESFTAINNIGNNDNDMLSKMYVKNVILERKISTKFEKLNSIIKQEQDQQQNVKNAEEQKPHDNEKEQGNKINAQQALFKFINDGSRIEKNYWKDSQPQLESATNKMFTGIKFSINENEDYSAEIMKVLNYLITVTSEIADETEKKSYFTLFSETMERIFQSVFVPDDFRFEKNIIEFVLGKAVMKTRQAQSSKESPNIHNQGSRDYAQEENVKILTIDELINSNFSKDPNRRKKYDEHKEIVKKYTSYKIGQKLDPNTELYTDNEIAEGIFKVKSTAVLRVITKWIEELSSKIKKAKDEILYNPFRVKMNNDKETQIKLSSGEKNDLYQSALSKKDEMTLYQKNMIQQCNEIEGILAKAQYNGGSKNSNIPKNELIVGKFCTRLASAASIYLINFLNKTIEFLLQMAKELKESNDRLESSIDLITFKVSDLMRCKCSSKQTEIIKILNLFQALDQKHPELLKIVRIKDRLELGTRDILLNISFMNRILCQIQLEINDQIDEKQKMYDSFNHFIYELSRSQLGPIMQCACIWTHLDQRAKQIANYLEKNKQEKLSKISHPCNRNSMVAYKLSFVCSKCQVFHPNSVGLIENKKCGLCKIYYECSDCIFKNMKEQQIKQFLEFNKTFSAFENKFGYWTDNKMYFPQFAIIISKKSKKRIYIFVQKILVNDKIYYIRVVENEQKQLEIEIVFTLKNQPSSMKEISNSYFVFEWLEKRHVNKILESSKQRQILDEQRRIKQEDTRRKEQEDKRNKEQLQRIKVKKQLEFREMVYGTKMKDQSSSSQSTTSPIQQTPSFQSQSLSQTRQNFVSDNPSPNKSIRSPSDRRAAPSRSRSTNISQNMRIEPKTDTSGTLGKRRSQSFNNETLATASEFNNMRVCQGQVGKQKSYLILNYFMSEALIMHKLKEQLTKGVISELLLSKKEVLMLEEEKVDNLLLDTIFSSMSFSACIVSVRYIYIDRNRLTRLDFLREFVNLNVLHANHNFIESMEGIQGLTNLQELMLAKNSISQICEFESADNLHTLFLGANQLGCYQRQQLYQDDRYMQYDPEEPGSHNNVANVPEKSTTRVFAPLKKMKKLTKLSLFENEIQFIDSFAELAELKKLIYLDLSLNMIDKFEGFGQSKKLEYLNLGSNNLQACPKLDVFSELTVLNLSCNRIRSIENISKNQNLQSLCLANNSLQKVENLELNKKLRQLDLSGNCITETAGFKELRSLRVLNLSYNKITDTDAAFFDLVNLEVLDLSLNCISSLLTHEILTYLKKLKNWRYFSIMNNPIDQATRNKLKDLRKNFKQKKVQFVAIA